MDSYSTARAQTTGGWIGENMPIIQGKVLDVGCGDKPYKRLFPEHDWTGLDIRAVGEIQADMHDLPLGDETYDTVLCVDTLQFSLKPLDAIAEMWRVVKPGGRLIIIAPNTAPEHSGGFLNIKLIGLKNMCELVTGKEVSAAAGFGLMKTEAGAIRRRSKFTGGWSAEWQGWIDDADQRFPVVSIVVVQK